MKLVLGVEWEHDRLPEYAGGRRCGNSKMIHQEECKHRLRNPSRVRSFLTVHEDGQDFKEISPP